jgi:probable phosphoglycerate mutase
MRILIVRHGEPDYSNDCLTPTGVVQAKAAARRLAGEKIGAIYSSSCGRAMQTARETAMLVGLPITVLDAMREIGWGSLDGTPIPENGFPWSIAHHMAEHGWSVTDPDWTRCPLFENSRVPGTVRRVAEGTDAWMASLGYDREGGLYVCRRPGAAPETVALFCHAGAAAAVFSRLMDLPFPYVCMMIETLPFAGILALGIRSRSVPMLEFIADDRHYPWLGL